MSDQSAAESFSEPQCLAEGSLQSSESLSEQLLRPAANNAKMQHAVWIVAETV